MKQEQATEFIKKYIFDNDSEASNSSTYAMAKQLLLDGLSSRQEVKKRKANMRASVSGLNSLFVVQRNMGLRYLRNSCFLSL